MRAVIQRVAQASVTGGGETASISKGIMVLLGISADDTKEDSDFVVKKLLGLRIFAHSESDSRWSESVTSISGEILCVSQFTLHAVYKANKPSFHRAMKPEQARTMFYDFVEQLRDSYNRDAVKACVFGSYMNVSLVNDGPVTLIVDSKEKKGS